MKTFFQVLLYILSIVSVWQQTGIDANAQSANESSPDSAVKDGESPMPQLPQLPPPLQLLKAESLREFTSSIFSNSNRSILAKPSSFMPPSFWPNSFIKDGLMALESAITKRLGVRYRYFGTDDRGYDCSGFIWRVFHETGVDFMRMPARMLWNQFPQATQEETKQFGTLVFFRGLKHVGIVRDENSFYHASRSHGITVSSFDSYWKRRVTGYRRAPMPLTPPPF